MIWSSQPAPSALSSLCARPCPTGGHLREPLLHAQRFALFTIGAGGFLTTLRTIEAMRAAAGRGIKPALFDCILRRPGCMMEDLVEAIYPDPDLEPDTAVSCIRASLHKLRASIEPHGYTIDGKTHLGRYYLRRISNAAMRASIPARSICTPAFSRAGRYPKDAI